MVERAGLGRATLYRNFPDRLALMTALMERGLDGLERLAADLGDRPDGLAVLLHDVAEHIAQSAPMVDFWRSIERAHPSVKAVDQRVVGIFYRSYSAPSRPACAARIWMKSSWSW